MTVGIRSIGLAVPEMYVPQAEAYEEFVRYFDLAPEEETLYRKILVENDAIVGRYIAMETRAEVVELDQDQLIARFLREGRKLAAAAARDALTQAELSVEDISGVVVNTCTGYVCPGLSSYLIEDLGMPTNVRTRDIVGMGCGGALPNMDTGASLIAQRSGEKVLCVSVEICTATLFMGPSPDLVVSNSIFGDGAAAVVLANEDSCAWRMIDFASGTYPAFRSDLQYRTEDHRLRNVLSKKVPIIAGARIKEVLAQLLDQNGLQQSDIAYFAVHPGGTQILDRVERDLGLARSDLAASYQILREYGNMSSPSVLFVLDRLMKNKPIKPGDKVVLIAFGAGFSVFATLLEFC